MFNIAIIPARGGSKRIPKKNIKEFCGRPIIAYSIDAAVSSGVFDEIMVSTDSEDIKAVAEQYGASVPFLRSEAASNDFATTADVLLEVVEEYKRRGMEFGTITCIYPTAPFVTGRKIRDAMARLNDEDGDSILTIVRYSYPPQRALVIKAGKATFQYPQYERTRSQDLDPIYHDCGQFYIIRTGAFLRERTLITKNTIPYLLPEEEVQDIDTISDWKTAEEKYKILHRGEQLCSVYTI